MRGTNFDGRMDGGTVHFVFPDLPEHTTTRDASGPKIKHSVSLFSLPILFNQIDLTHHTTVCVCVHVRFIHQNGVVWESNITSINYMSK